MIANRIKSLRKQSGMTQTELAKKLGITRASVNAWELGVSVPSTQYLIELSKLFKISTDFLLGISKESAIDLNGLKEEDILLIHKIIERLKRSTK